MNRKKNKDKKEIKQELKTKLLDDSSDDEKDDVLEIKEEKHVELSSIKIIETKEEKSSNPLHEWFKKLLKDHDLSHFKTQWEEGLALLAKEENSNKWTLLHYFIAYGYYAGVLAALNEFSIEGLDQPDANGITPLDLAILLHQHRIENTLRLLGFRTSNVSAEIKSENRIHSSATLIPLLFWSIVKSQDELLKKLLSTTTQNLLSGIFNKYKENLLDLAYYLNNRNALKIMGAMNQLMSTPTVLSIEEVEKMNFSISVYLNFCHHNQSPSHCLRVATSLPRESVTTWLNTHTNNNVLTPNDLKIFITNRQPHLVALSAIYHPELASVAIHLLTQNQYLYAFYMVYQNIQNQLAVCSDIQLYNQAHDIIHQNPLGENLLTSSPHYNYFLLLDTIICSPSQRLAALTIDSPTAIFFVTLLLRPSILASIVMAFSSNKHLGTLDKITNKQLSIFAYLLADKYLPDLTRAGIQLFTLMHPQKNQLNAIFIQSLLKLLPKPCLDSMLHEQSLLFNPLILKIKNFFSENFIPITVPDILIKNTPILSLPEDPQKEIFTFLNIKDLIVLSLVNKSFHEVLQIDAYSKQKQELYAKKHLLKSNEALLAELKIILKRLQNIINIENQYCTALFRQYMPDNPRDSRFSNLLCRFYQLFLLVITPLMLITGVTGGAIQSQEGTEGFKEGPYVFTSLGLLGLMFSVFSCIFVVCPSRENGDKRTLEWFKNHHPDKEFDDLKLILQQANINYDDDLKLITLCDRIRTTINQFRKNNETLTSTITLLEQQGEEEKNADFTFD